MATIKVMCVKKLWDSLPASGAVVVVGGVSSYTANASGYINIESTGVTSGPNNIVITYGRYGDRSQAITFYGDESVINNAYIHPNKRYMG